MLTFQDVLLLALFMLGFPLGCLAMRQQVRYFFTWLRARRNDSVD